MKHLDEAKDHRKVRSWKSRFFSQIQLDIRSNCWLWLGHLNESRWGYGKFWHNGKSHRVHRFAKEMFSGELIPEGLEACHTCDRPECVNPSHIFIGTRKQNYDDSLAKGRHLTFWKMKNYAQGDRVGAAKLISQDIAVIRERAAKGECLDKIAQEFKVQRPAIWKIVTRRTWRHISLIILYLSASACVATDVSKPREITVGGQTFLFWATTATGSCTETTTGYLSDTNGKLLDKSTAAGVTLPCAALAGSVAAGALAGGLSASGDTVSSSSTSGASATQIGHGFHREHYKPTKKGHGERD